MGCVTATTSLYTPAAPAFHQNTPPVSLERTDSSLRRIMPDQAQKAARPLSFLKRKDRYKYSRGKRGLRPRCVLNLHCHYYMQTCPFSKVFFSSSAQISRLIESLSQGADAGSFNFIPNAPNRTPGHSASSSVSTNDINWTVEERLERMLGAMGNS